MSIKAILIVAGEPYSVFSEILFKSLIKINSRRPIVLIASKKLLEKQMKKLGYKFRFKEIDKDLPKKSVVFFNYVIIKTKQIYISS